MNAETQSCASAGRGTMLGGGVGPCLLLLVIYAAGLTHGVARPWTGMHDWNGAFFSQLGRNFLRYPMSVHRGMPVVAVGEAVPPPEERSIYATHPPGLVWLVALSFRVFGTSEWAARLAPIAFSLAALALLVYLVERAWGRDTAVTAGLIYAVMPMAVYFGRMVDHEAVCLFLMLAAVVLWQAATDPRAGPGRRRWTLAGWALALAGAVWVDWSGVLFAGVFALHAGAAWVRGRIQYREFVLACALPALACGGMVAYLVWAGLGGRWGDLVAVFLSRATDAQGDVLFKGVSAWGGVWDYTVENLTWPVVVLSVAGMVLVVVKAWRRRARGGRVEEVAAQAAIAGTRIVMWTGVLWVLVFWRQYERHNYWFFYLGPAAAVFSARALLAFRERLRPLGARVADAAFCAALAVTAAFGLRGTDDYFSRVSYPSAEVAAWRGIHARTKDGDRVLLFRNPLRREQRGGYLFRNIVPPQLAYYLDRGFDVEREIGAGIERASRYAGYVISIEDAVAHGTDVEALRWAFPEEQMVSQLFFDFRTPLDGAAVPAAEGVDGATPCE